MSASASTAFLVEHWLFVQLPPHGGWLVRPAGLGQGNGTEPPSSGGWMSTLLGSEGTGRDVEDSLGDFG